MKLTMMFKLDFLKNDVYRIQNPGAERVDAKSQYILHRKWTRVCILCTHQKSYTLDKSIMLIFVSETKQITFGKGCICINDQSKQWFW